MQILYFFIISMSLFFKAEVNVKTFPSVDVTTLNGKKVNISDYVANGKPTIISFWATWCAPCKRELDTITEYYPEWQEKYDVELIAITIDNSRGLRKVPAMVSAKQWKFTVLADSNQSLQQALSFQTIPQTYVLDGKGNIVYEHTGYAAGDELELEEVLGEME